MRVDKKGFTIAEILIAMVILCLCLMVTASVFLVNNKIINIGVSDVIHYITGNKPEEENTATLIFSDESQEELEPEVTGNQVKFDSKIRETIKNFFTDKDEQGSEENGETSPPETSETTDEEAPYIELIINGDNKIKITKENYKLWIFISQNINVKSRYICNEINKNNAIQVFESLQTEGLLSPDKEGELRSACYYLSEDIDLTDLTDWKGINYFTGQLYGNKKTISNLTGNQGLFTSIKGTDVVLASPEGLEYPVDKTLVKDIYLTNFNITTEETTSVGALAGLVKTGGSQPVIKNIKLDKFDIEAPKATVGGLIGSLNSLGEYSNLVINGQTTTDNEYLCKIKANHNTGGLIGYLGEYIKVSDSAVKNISIIKTENTTAWVGIGGFVGHSYGTIHNSIVKDIVFSKEDGVTTKPVELRVGGFVGIADQCSELVNNKIYNIKAQLNARCIGGLAGLLKGTADKISIQHLDLGISGPTASDKYRSYQISPFAGEFSEGGNTASLTNSFANYIKTRGSDRVGGFAGALSNSENIISNSYVNNLHVESLLAWDTKNTPDVGGIAGFTGGDSNKQNPGQLSNLYVSAVWKQWPSAYSGINFGYRNARYKKVMHNLYVWNSKALSNDNPELEKNPANSKVKENYTKADLANTQGTTYSGFDFENTWVYTANTETSINSVTLKDNPELTGEAIDNIITSYSDFESEDEPVKEDAK